MWKLLVVLLVLAGLFVAADFGARAYAESRAATELQRSFDLSRKPSVGLGGFPFLLHAADGHFASISLSDSDFRAQGVAIRTVHLTLHEVRFSLSALASGRGGTIGVKRGDGVASLTGDAVTAMVRAQGAPATVRFAGGKVVVGVTLIGGQVEGTLSLRGNHLEVRGQGPMAFSLPLPRIVPGIRYTGVSVQGDAAVLTFEVGRQTFQV
jgi:hypothetical protein